MRGVRVPRESGVRAIRAWSEVTSHRPVQGHSAACQSHIPIECQIRADEHVGQLSTRALDSPSKNASTSGAGRSRWLAQREQRPRPDAGTTSPSTTRAASTVVTCAQVAHRLAERTDAMPFADVQGLAAEVAPVGALEVAELAHDDGVDLTRAI